MEKKAKTKEYQNKYITKLKEQRPTNEKKIKVKEEFIHCQFCNKSVRHYYLHTRTKGHKIIEKLFKEREESQQQITNT